MQRTCLLEPQFSFMLIAVAVVHLLPQNACAADHLSGLPSRQRSVALGGDTGSRNEWRPSLRDFGDSHSIGAKVGVQVTQQKKANSRNAKGLCSNHRVGGYRIGRTDHPGGQAGESPLARQPMIQEAPGQPTGAFPSFEMRDARLSFLHG